MSLSTSREARAAASFDAIPLKSPMSLWDLPTPALVIDVEAMEGFAVLRACELAGVPAVEARIVSNEIDEPDRALWRFDDAFAALAESLPKLVAVASGA